MKAWIWQDEYATDMGLQFDISATGFRLRGREVIRYTDVDEVDLAEGDVLHGIASDVHALGLSQIPDYPRELIDWAVPHEKHMLEYAQTFDYPFFIKPVAHREFSGFVAEGPQSLRCIEGNPEVWVATAVEMHSEWRVYVLEGEIVKVCHYKGDPCVFPNERCIRSMITDWPDAPAAWALDVAVEGIGHTILVETNDMFCLGNYGVDSCDFAKMLEARWKQVWEEGFDVRVH